MGVKGLNPYRFKALHDFPGFALDCVSLCHKIVLNTSLFLFLLKIKRRKNVFNTFLVALKTVTLSRQANGNRPCKGGSFFKSVPFGASSPPKEGWMGGGGKRSIDATTLCQTTAAF